MKPDGLTIWMNRVLLIAGLLSPSRVDDGQLLDHSGFMSRLGALGFPSSFEELQRLCDLPSEENAARHYLTAFEAYSQGVGELAQAALQQRVRDDLIDSVVEHIDQALKHSRCSFERNWDAGVDLEFVELQPMKRLAELCLARAEFKHSEGQLFEALTELDRSIGIGLHVREPALISCLVSIAIEMKALRALAEMCVANPGHSDFLESARDWIDRLPPLPERQSALGFEMLMISDVLKGGDLKGIQRSLGLQAWDPTRAIISLLLRSEDRRRLVADRFYNRLGRHVALTGGSSTQDVSNWSDYDTSPSWSSDEYEHIAWNMQSPFCSHFFAWVRAEQTRELVRDTIDFLSQARTEQERSVWQPRLRDRSLGHKICAYSGNGLTMGFVSTPVGKHVEKGAMLRFKLQPLPE